MRQTLAKFIKPSNTNGDVLTTVAGRSVWAAAAASDPEFIRDTIAAALVEGSGVTITVDDAANTITISSTGGGVGGSGAWTLISAQKLTVATADINFANIPDAYRDLVIEGKYRSSRANITDNVALRVGTGGVIDTGATSYRAHVTVNGGTDTNTASTLYFKVCEKACPGASADADVWGSIRATIYDYADAAYWREVESAAVAHPSNVGPVIIARDALNGHWKNKSGAIDCLRLSALNGNFVVGSSFRLYGRS